MVRGAVCVKGRERAIQNSSSYSTMSSRGQRVERPSLRIFRSFASVATAGKPIWTGECSQRRANQRNGNTDIQNSLAPFLRPKGHGTATPRVFPSGQGFPGGNATRENYQFK